MSTTADDVIIRVPTLNDLSRLTEIYNYYIVETPITFDIEPLTVEQRRSWFERYSDSGRHRLLVAERDGTIIGYTSSSPYYGRAAYDTTVESTILCAPEAVGQGIGKRLYAALFEALASEDVHTIVAAITLPNRGSCEIHEHFGFRRVGVIEEAGRKFGQYWDVAWYQRVL